MKKLIFLACSLLLVVTVSACSDKKDKTTTVCTGVISGLDEVMTFTATGDELETQKEEFHMPLAELGVAEDELDALMSVLLQQIFGDDQLEGTKGTYEIKDMEVHFTFTVDYTKVDLDKLAEAKFIEEGAITTKYISLEKSLESYKAQGLTCKENK